VWLFERKGGKSKGQFLIAEGDAGQPKFMEKADAFVGWSPTRLPRIEPGSGEPYTPFQVSDLIAYEHRLTYSRWMDDDLARGLRKSFEYIRHHLPVKADFMDEPALRAWCASSAIPRR
jgi:hypothetical protein